MKSIKIFLLLFIILLEAGYPQDDSGFFSIQLKNNSAVSIYNEAVILPLDLLTGKHPDLNTEALLLTYNNNTIPFEIITDDAGQQKKMVMLLSFNPGEVKEIVFSKGTPAPADDLTQAYIGEKKNYKKEDGYYTGGKFESVKYVRVPKDHFAHDALYQYEGPGWESDKVGYRLYLDERNRTDIFGKKKPGLITDQIGKNDLVSDGKESYQQMQDWGQDIFKVGNSLGIGSVAAYYDSVITISDYDNVTCEVFDNNLLSAVKTKHYGWNLNGKKTDVECYYTIKAGSRLTHVQVRTRTNVDNFCTGIAKHKDTEFFVSENNPGWNYIALWGKQTTANDNLGVAVFYKSDSLVKQTEDALSHIVILNGGTEPEYYFAAAWEQERDGIKNKDGFKKFLDDEIKKLNEPVQIIRSSD